MRTLILPLLIALSLTAFADNDTSDSRDHKPVQLLNKLKKNPKRPKAPSRQQISCIYSGETLFINFLIDEGEATLSITNNENGQISIYTFNTAYPTEIAVGELTSATIEINTSAGNTYEGEL